MWGNCGYGYIDPGGGAGVEMFENAESDEKFEFPLLEPLPDRRGLNVPFLETNNVAMRPAGGVSRSALPSFIDMLQVLKCADASLR